MKKTKYNWVNVPKWVTHIATDESGEVYGYYKKPLLHPVSCCWASGNENRTTYLGETDLTDWGNSLEERPDFVDVNQAIFEVIKKHMPIGYPYVDFMASKCTDEILSILDLNNEKQQ